MRRKAFDLRIHKQIGKELHAGRSVNPIRLRSYSEYLLEMKAVRMGSLARERCDELLHDLYRLARRRMQFEEWADSERVEAPGFHVWRRFLKSAQPRLHSALRELVEIAEKCPGPSEVELFFDAEEFRLGIVDIAHRLEHSNRCAEGLQVVVAALVNPKLRSSAEKRMVKQELFARYGFSARPKSKEIDH